MSDLVHVKGLAGLDKFLQELPPKVERNVARGAMRAAAATVRPVAQANIHSVSGALAKSLKIRTDAKGGLVTAKVYTNLFYARFVEFGTKPHVIRPKNRKALSVGGATVEWVQHPGSRGFGFLRNALDTTAYAAVVAAAEYTKKRLATKHGLDAADVEIGG